MNRAEFWQRAFLKAVNCRNDEDEECYTRYASEVADEALVQLDQRFTAEELEA